MTHGGPIAITQEMNGDWTRFQRNNGKFWAISSLATVWVAPAWR
jgi:hypothetical protein